MSKGNENKKLWKHLYLERVLFFSSLEILTSQNSFCICNEPEGFTLTGTFVVDKETKYKAAEEQFMIYEQYYLDWEYKSLPLYLD